MSDNETEGPILDQLAVDWSKVKLALAKFSDPPSTGKLGCHGSAVPGVSATGGIRVAALTLMSTLFPNRFLVHLVDLMAGAGTGFGLAARMDASAAPVVARVLTKIKEAEAMRSEELLNSLGLALLVLLIVLTSPYSITASFTISVFADMLREITESSARLFVLLARDMFRPRRGGFFRGCR